ncbi:haloacid dehalogenase, type II [Kwoniella sp. DSM 27419]
MAGALPEVRSVTFDLMGTCADYTTSLLSTLAGSSLPQGVAHAQLIKDWRAGFFARIFELHNQGRDQEMSVDEVHREVLDALLGRVGVDLDELGEEERERLVQGWHRQVGWPDAVEGITRLRRKYDCVVVANGTTRLQLDITRSSGLPFHALFSSQLIGYTKPDQRMYRSALDLLGREPYQVAMVAAHAYDLRAAKEVGMRTIYIQRDTEDPDEDMERIKAEVDLFVDGRTATGSQGGLNHLAALLGCD